MFPALKTYHVSSTHHDPKFGTPELVCVTQTGLRTADVGVRNPTGHTVADRPALPVL